MLPVPSDKPQNGNLGGPEKKQPPTTTCELSEPTYDFREWSEDFSRWALWHCVFRDGCYGGVTTLYKEWCEWCFREQVVPANLPTFRALLANERFMLAGPFPLAEHGMVYGLLLREDWGAACAASPSAPAQEPERSADCKPAWRGDLLRTA